MSTPVICANEDFFPQVHASKNTENMRLRDTCLSCIRDFHSGFHRTGCPNGTVPRCGGNQMMFLTAQPCVPHCVYIGEPVSRMASAVSREPEARAEPLAAEPLKKLREADVRSYC